MWQTSEISDKKLQTTDKMSKLVKKNHKMWETSEKSHKLIKKSDQVVEKMTNLRKKTQTCKRES